MYGKGHYVHDWRNDAHDIGERCAERIRFRWGGGGVAGMVSYVMGSSIGEKVYSTIKKVAQGAKKTNIKGI